MTVLGYLPNLKFLDSNPVTQEERDSAEVHFKTRKRADESEYQKKGQIAVVSEADSLLVVDTQEDMSGASFAKTKFTAYGRSSQGNRFITDADLS